MTILIGQAVAIRTAERATTVGAIRTIAIRIVAIITRLKEIKPTIAATMIGQTMVRRIEIRDQHPVTTMVICLTNR